MKIRARRLFAATVARHPAVAYVDYPGLATHKSHELARRTFDAGVLLVYAAERQWAKLCFEYSPQLQPTAVTVVTRESSDDCNSFEVDGHTLWLRITRSGAAWAFHASTDGAWWRRFSSNRIKPLAPAPRHWRPRSAPRRPSAPRSTPLRPLSPSLDRQ